MATANLETRYSKWAQPWKIDRGIDGENYWHKIDSKLRFGFAAPSVKACLGLMCDQTKLYNDRILACILKLDSGDLQHLELL